MTEEKELQSRTPRPRLFQLDSLRGIAAVVVVLHHCRYAFSNTVPVWYLRPFFAGTQAVALFFVLSGYVLSLPFWADKQEAYPRYLLRRFCRIYIPYAAAAMISIMFAYHFQGRWLPLPGWYFRTWHTPITGHLIIKQFLMVPLDVFNTAFWSLTFEMALSIVLPFCLMLMRWCNPIVVTIVSCLLVYGKPQWLVLDGRPRINQGLEIACLFFIGATLARYNDQLRNFWHRLGGFSWVFLCIFIELLTVTIPLPQFPFSSRIQLVEGVGAAGIILSALYMEKFANVLQYPLFEYFGRVSYSLYLIHGTILFASLDLLYWHLPKVPLILVTILLAFLFAHLFCIFIEEPSIWLGKLIPKSQVDRPSSLVGRP
jgi:peptidoglycan/LPS O-acetylase OafA/YrhL